MIDDDEGVPRVSIDADIIVDHQQGRSHRKKFWISWAGFLPAQVFLEIKSRHFFEASKKILDRLLFRKDRCFRCVCFAHECQFDTPNKERSIVVRHHVPFFTQTMRAVIRVLRHFLFLLLVSHVQTAAPSVNMATPPSTPKKGKDERDVWTTLHQLLELHRAGNVNATWCLFAGLQDLRRYGRSPVYCNAPTWTVLVELDWIDQHILPTLDTNLPLLGAFARELYFLYMTGSIVPTDREKAIEFATLANAMEKQRH
jgi:hypothetical protein